ncbi:hypothetical protein PLEOSDRAFT_1110953 [Pleurotus ostreatus PC15]|uniref:Uncharacterized protein n=1 Tax=Pleurotus ostreatus (strain PC15) TaxID=1137138 RepID=A0A067NV72_PLEO1|nr:hypothetical protein PLEOSDRAFT_1110953 [Pleurotus ostreatus PC15]
MVHTSFSGIPRAGNSNMAGHSSGGAKGIILGMSGVIVGLGAFYAHLHRKHEKKTRSGTNPYYEQRIAFPDPPLSVARLESIIESQPPVAPRKVHDAKHFTLANFVDTEARYMQPTPQRSSADDPNRAYTKRP